MNTKTRILPTAIESNPTHIELPEGMGGLTEFRSGEATAIHTPPNPLIRIHEMLHAHHSGGRPLHGKNPFVQQIIEDLYIHTQHWPWAYGNTPADVAEPSLAMLSEEQTKIASTLDATERGVAFGLAMRDHVAANKITFTKPPAWMTRAERDLMDQITGAVEANKCQLAAELYEKAFFPEKPEDKPEEEDKPKGKDKPKPGSEDGESEDGESEDGESEDGESEDGKSEDGESEDGEEESTDGEDETDEPTLGDKPDDKPAPSKEKTVIPNAVITMDDQGPFTEPCGEPTEDWNLATTGPRLNRAALRKPVLPSRIFMKRRAVNPGGVIIIDASGSMAMDTNDLLALCRAIPQATIAFYSGNDNPTKPVGKIYVAAQEGFRREEEAIKAYIDSRQYGNTIDLEAIEWLLERDGPRTMITDRGFTGSYNSAAALVKLEDQERQGEITVVTDWKELIAAKEEESC